jgi:hypothetical protein
VLDLKNIYSPLYLSDKELLKLLKFNDIEELDKKYNYDDY